MEQLTLFSLWGRQKHKLVKGKSEDAPGIRTNGMISKVLKGTRESRQSQGENLVEPNKRKRERFEGMSAVGLADSTLR